MKKTLSTYIIESVNNERKKTKVLKEAKKENDYSNTVPANVLQKIDEMLSQSYSGARWKIDNVYDDLSIFDWWPEYLSQSHLKQMRTFLRNAISAGFDKYCCFKVGASGCANGMWASDVPSTDGHSPDGGRTLYRSFTPDYTYYDVDLGNGFTHNDFKTFKECRDFIEHETKDMEELKNTETEPVQTGTEEVNIDLNQELVGKTVNEACMYLSDITGLTFNSTRVNARQYKLLASQDNYVIVTVIKDKITTVNESTIKGTKESINESVNTGLDSEPLKDLTPKEFLKMLDDKFPEGYHVETNAGDAEYSKDNGWEDGTLVPTGPDDLVYPFRTPLDFAHYILDGAKETFGDMNFNEVLECDGKYGMPHFIELESINESSTMSDGDLLYSNCKDTINYIDLALENLKDQDSKLTSADTDIRFRYENLLTDLEKLQGSVNEFLEMLKGGK